MLYFWSNKASLHTQKKNDIVRLDVAWHKISEVNIQWSEPETVQGLANTVSLAVSRCGEMFWLYEGGWLLKGKGKTHFLASKE